MMTCRQMTSGKQVDVTYFILVQISQRKGEENLRENHDQIRSQYCQSHLNCHRIAGGTRDVGMTRSSHAVLSPSVQRAYLPPAHNTTSSYVLGRPLHKAAFTRCELTRASQVPGMRAQTLRMYLCRKKSPCKAKYIIFCQALCLVEIFYLPLCTGTDSELWAACFVAG
jgi:hypothetical protein